ncbi:ABC transporter ATP-binding protein [Tunturibacter empetritectus]|uniref:ATP-binding cassette subfamily B protein n=2 Tax=Tunturiibacter empetritectus TaxID=3069691 RepID=A0A7W8MQ50_9BACT|nr:ABC transporter ATP-binding protein [Edaphobacter lichenicola]MBB5316168.1 ATP-binding cassette subfamily B protein [Edaphobacter lichenicola]
MKDPVKAESPWRDRIRALQNMPAVLRILWQSGRAVVTWGLFLRLVVAMLPFGIAKIAAYILNDIAEVIRGHALAANFWHLVAAEVVLNVSLGLITRAIDYSDSLLANRYTQYVSVRVMEQAARLDLTTYEDPVFYDRLERARVQATDRLAMIQQLGRLVTQIITTLAFSAALAFASPWLVLLLALGVLPSFLGETHYAFLGYAKNFRQTPAKRQMDYLRQVAGSREGAKEVKLFGLNKFFTNRFQALADQIYLEDVTLSRSKLIVGGLLGVIGTLGYYGAYVYVIWRTLHGAYNIGQFGFLTTAIQQASSNLQQVFSTASGIADQALFLTDLIAFFDMKPTVISNPDGHPAPAKIQRGFEFRNVSFTYPGTNRTVLKNFNLTLSPGERIALIGENGQGKTTVVKLITRLYDPTEGEILLDGIDLREYNLEDLHRNIGVIFQDFMRFEMTARENIAVGRVDQPYQDSDIEVAAHKSLADTVVDKLAGGYDQMLGRRFEGGVELSGGEWQKIALARAYLRDAQLLILDEPTAALDARSELEVFERFAELTLGKMALLISHRFSTVRMADRIVVLAGGRLIEEGNHQQLIEKNGLYASMFEMQAASYR